MAKFGYGMFDEEDVKASEQLNKQLGHKPIPKYKGKAYDNQPRAWKSDWEALRAVPSVPTLINALIPGRQTPTSERVLQRHIQSIPRLKKFQESLDFQSKVEADRKAGLITEYDERQGAANSFDMNKVNAMLEKDKIAELAEGKKGSQSTVFTEDKDGNRLGVMTRNQRKAWEASNPDWQNWQPEGPEYKMPSVLEANGNLKSSKTITKEASKIPQINERSQGILDRVQSNIPKKHWQELTKGTSLADKTGGNAKLAGNLGTASAVLSIASKFLDKKKKPSTEGMEGKGGNIDQVAVAAGIDPEQFYSYV